MDTWKITMMIHITYLTYIHILYCPRTHTYSLSPTPVLCCLSVCLYSRKFCLISFVHWQLLFFMTVTYLFFLFLLWFYIASLMIENAFLYTSSIALHRSRSAATPWSSRSKSSNRFSRYSSATSRFWTDSRVKFTRRCIIALGTRSWIDLRTILK